MKAGELPNEIEKNGCNKKNEDIPEEVTLAKKKTLHIKGIWGEYFTKLKEQKIMKYWKLIQAFKGV